MNRLKNIQKRINRGVKLLDKRLGRKNWAKKIDLEKLDLGRPGTCVLGEVYGNYIDGLEALGDDSKFMPEDFAFDVDDKDFSYDFGYNILTKMWFATLIRLGIGLK